MSFDGMRNYIIDNELTDSVIIILHPDNFDTVALDYISIYETIQRPFEILGIEVREDDSGTIAKNEIRLIEA